MTKRTIVVMTAVVLCAAMDAQAQDTFGTGANQFTIDFVTISGATNPASGFGIVADDYRMGTYEITNDQWSKFQASLGVPLTGDPASAYDTDGYYGGASIPTDQVSWLEAAQFVNWLNTSTGHHAAYKFTGTQGQSDYAFDMWGAASADNGTNLYRHRDAFYFLPTEDEWVKAAYWNGVGRQTYATTDDAMPVAGVDTNYANWFETPWVVGSGSEELNGTYDMMGNVWEWLESPYYPGGYGLAATRGFRGASSSNDSPALLAFSNKSGDSPDFDNQRLGFRVASVPEPATMSLLALGGLALLRRRNVNA